MEYRTVDPASGELLETFPLAMPQEVEAALTAAEATFEGWRRTPVTQRAELLRRLAEALETNAEEHGRRMAVEMGKPLAQGRAEAEKCAWVCRYYADHSEAFLASRVAESDGSAAQVRHDPLGPLLAIMPWNFPYWQLFRFAAPALVAGNTVLLKHAPNTPRCAAAIAELFTAADAPPGLFQNLYLSDEQAAEVIAHRAIRGVTLTGSGRAGRSVAATAGRHLKKTVLELGGSDPFLVFADAELERAVEVGVDSRTLNSGQSCIAAKRFLVQREVFERFCERFTAAMAERPPGHPLAEGTRLGPLARDDLRQQLADQVDRIRARGGRVRLGGAPQPGPGFFYPPTVITELDPGLPEAQEELFGPVALLFPFRDEEEAVRLANGTPFGLGASLWTADSERPGRLAPRLDTGSVFVNGMVKSDPRLPFGGIKESGYGRELARDGLLEWVNAKTVWIA